MATWYSVTWVYHHVFNHSFIAGHLGYSNFCCQNLCDDKQPLRTFFVHKMFKNALCARCFLLFRVSIGHFPDSGLARTHLKHCSGYAIDTFF